LDKGQSRALSPEARETLARLRKKHPEVNVTTLIRQLHTTGVIDVGTVSMASIYRYLRTVGLDPRSMKGASNMQSGPTKAFELAYANDVWMSDTSHGPRLARPGKSALRTFLIALLDDCSRLCPHAQYYPAERLEHFLDVLKHALQARGVPDKLYTDNAKVFTSRHLQTICANIGIRLIHHKPYRAWSKGKIERLFLTVQRDFEQRLVFDPVSSIDELNERFWRWLEEEYHQRVHRSLAGQSPAERFALHSRQLRLLDDELDLDGLFLARTTRRVRRDATISLDGRIFEAPLAVRGRKVEVHYDPFAFERVELYIEDIYLGSAQPCDKELNSRSFNKENYENLE
jgi:transposase InsO family protein